MIGHHRSLTVAGHYDVIKRIPFKRPQNLALLNQYYRQPGNYQGRENPYTDADAKVLNYGNDYLALKLSDDITRPELGEFLQNKGWKLLGIATAMEDGELYLVEKWSSVSD